METIFTTYLYLFSSLLQADAAILGFGAIFVIYKLQSLDNRYQLAYQTCQSSGKLVSEHSTKLMSGVDEAEMYDLISVMIRQPHIYRQYELLVTIPKRKSKVKRLVVAPTYLIGFHCIFTAVMLWLAPEIAGTTIGGILSVLVLLLFSAGIILSGSVGLSVVRTRDELSLRRYYPKVQAQIEKLLKSQGIPDSKIDLSGDDRA